MGKSTTRSPLFRELPSGARQSAFRAENHPGAACPTGANPCKQRRLQPLPCRALLEACERVCTARQREWYRRELDDHKVFVSWFNRGQRLFLFTAGSPGTYKKVEKVRVHLKSRKFSLFLQTQLDFALNSLEIHKGFLRLFALNPACACEIFVIFFVFRYTSGNRRNSPCS